MVFTFLIILGILLVINLLLLIFSTNSTSQKANSKLKPNGPKYFSKNKKPNYVVYADK